MKKLILIMSTSVLMMAAMSCASQKQVKMDGEWTITNACGVNTVGGDKQAAIIFDGKGNVNGNASVNSFFGSYEVVGDSLKFGPMGMTRMMGGSMEMEDAITRALGVSATVKVDGNIATVYDKGGNVIMTLKRK